MGIKPWRIRPTEAFPKSAVWSSDIPMTGYVWNINSTLRPIILPLGNLHPENGCKKQRQQAPNHSSNIGGSEFNRFFGVLGIELNFQRKCSVRSCHNERFNLSSSDPQLERGVKCLTRYTF